MTDAKDGSTTPEQGSTFAPAAGGPVDLAQRLRDVEAHYSRLIEHLPAVIYVEPVDPGAPMIDVSPNIEELFGATRD